MKINTDFKKIEELLSRGVEETIKKDSLFEKLKSGKKLRIKHGVDPTTKDLHLGYSVVYEKLRILQEMGHQIIFLIGDFTGRFGDPSQKSEVRNMRTKKEVRSLAKNYLRQISKILDLDKTEIRYNSEWYDKMSAEELLRLMSHFTTIRMLERDMFQERIKKEMEIRLHEPVYPVLQGYDSVILKSDIALCGTDQIFNEIRGRHLQKEFNQSPQDIIAVKILVGIDGKEKMSQSLGNYIGIEDSPKNQYGKIMSIPDELIVQYFELITRVSFKEIEKIKKAMKEDKLNPRDAKARLAREIVELYHGKQAAIKAEKEFNQIFKQKKMPSDISEIKIREKSLNILDLLVKLKLVLSRGEAKRLILQNGVKINKEIQDNWQKTIEIKKGMIIQVGKRKFKKII